jgi:hypothetical protein
MAVPADSSFLPGQGRIAEPSGALRIAVHAALFAGLLIGMLAMPRGEFVLVVGKPGQSEAQMIGVIGEAGGSFVSSGRYGWIAVAHSDQHDFTRKLFKAGAFLVLNHALAVGCLQRNF